MTLSKQESTVPSPSGEPLQLPLNFTPLKKKKRGLGLER